MFLWVSYSFLRLLSRLVSSLIYETITKNDSQVDIYFSVNNLYFYSKIFYFIDLPNLVERTKLLEIYH